MMHVYAASVSHVYIHIHIYLVTDVGKTGEWPHLK
jgi:hypothetical protein